MKAFLGAAALSWIAVAPASAQVPTNQPVVFAAWVQYMIDRPQEWTFDFNCYALGVDRPYCTYSFNNPSGANGKPYSLMIHTDAADNLISREGCEFSLPLFTTRVCFHVETVTNTREMYDTGAKTWYITQRTAASPPGFPYPPGYQVEPERPQWYPQPQPQRPTDTQIANRKQRLLALLK